MYTYEDLMRFFLQLSIRALIVIIALFILSVIIKWVFYYTIVKSGTRDAISSALAEHDSSLQKQQYELQRRLQEQQIEIQRLQAMLGEQGK